MRDNSAQKSSSIWQHPEQDDAAWRQATFLHPATLYTIRVSFSLVYIYWYSLHSLLQDFSLANALIQTRCQRVILEFIFHNKRNKIIVFMIRSNKYLNVKENFAFSKRNLSESQTKTDLISETAFQWLYGRDKVEFLGEYCHKMWRNMRGTIHQRRQVVNRRVSASKPTVLSSFHMRRSCSVRKHVACDSFGGAYTHQNTACRVNIRR